jgi:hypothetical protein
MPGRPQAPAIYQYRRKVLSELSEAFASVIGGRLSLAEARRTKRTFASEAMAAAASLEKSRPVKFSSRDYQIWRCWGLGGAYCVLMPVTRWLLFGSTFIFFAGSCIDVTVLSQW